jgi:hypothetical protein
LNSDVPTLDQYLSALPTPLKEIKNDGGGECMFKTLSVVVYGDEKYFAEVRQMVMTVVDIEKELLKAYVHTETIAAISLD